MKLNSKAMRIYLMLDRKGLDCALVKIGITADILKNRLCKYKTTNPWLECIAICEIRKTQNLMEVEKLFHQFCKDHFTFICGEWYLMTGEKEIEELATKGFDYFGKLKYRVKNKEMINKKICDMWKSRNW